MNSLFPFIPSLLAWVLLYLVYTGLNASPVCGQTTREEASFHFLVWPYPDSLITGATDPETQANRFSSAWYNGHLPTYTGKALQMILPKTDSIQTYLETIQSVSPECLEGDAHFIAQEVNADTLRYIPVLKQAQTQHGQAEIVFRSSPPSWAGPMGLIHQAFSNGGYRQILYWEAQRGTLASWVSFYSAEEALRHLLAGTVQAAALPEGMVESFLRQQDRMPLLAGLSRIPIPDSYSSPLIFIRSDLYHDLLTRTLVTETWLRNFFSEELIPATLTPLGP